MNQRSAQRITQATLLFVAIGVVVTIVKTAGLQAQKDPPGAGPLIVHEWGTFTSVAGKNGVALEWRPLNGASDLPKFVHTIQNAGDGLRHGPKANLTAAVRMETPVVYFYAANETEISVKVDFPKGKITEWYPQARSVNTSIDWGRLKIMPGANLNLPVAYSDTSRYYAARETDAAPVQVCGTDGQSVQQEKFLFYRGVGTFELPLTVKLDGQTILLTNADKQPISEVLLFENRAGKVGYQLVHNLSGDRALNRPALDQNIDSLLAELKRVLIASGLYEKEAAAMIKTWRDSWFEEGLRVFYILPRQTTDAVLPITIDPRPSELVRVLVGRAEVITPEMEKSVREQIRQLGDASPQIREAAARSIRERGRFSEPILKSILESESNETIRERIKQLIQTSETE
jgi:hypothetical protein